MRLDRLAEAEAALLEAEQEGIGVPVDLNIRLKIAVLLGAVQIASGREEPGKARLKAAIRVARRVLAGTPPAGPEWQLPHGQTDLIRQGRGKRYLGLVGLAMQWKTRAEHILAERRAVPADESPAPETARGEPVPPQPEPAAAQRAEKPKAPPVVTARKLLETIDERLGWAKSHQVRAMQFSESGRHDRVPAVLVA